jgi:hypothetical protein
MPVLLFSMPKRGASTVYRGCWYELFSIARRRIISNVKRTDYAVLSLRIFRKNLESYNLMGGDRVVGQ